MEVRENKLFIGGISAEELIERYGSPLYVYNEKTIRQRYSDLVKNIPYKKLKIFYACKANTNLAIMKVLNELGSSVDCVSTGEIFIAMKAGFSPDRIMFTSNNVTDEEMKHAIEKKIMINVDSLPQLERYGKLNPNSSVCVRINPDVGGGHHDHVITGGSNSKFGIYFDRTAEIFEIADKYNLKIVGIHQHIGSGILDPSKFLYAMDVLLKTAKEFKKLEFINFGGGIGVPYRPSERPMDLEEFGKKISERFENFCKEYGKELVMEIEPGRYIVCESGFLLAKVNTIKTTDHKKFVGVNSGFNHLIRHAMYGSYHPVHNASNVDGEIEKAIIVGNICESGDKFTESRIMTKFKEGDVVAILNAGAYGFSMASEYNSRVLPAEVLVSDGQTRIIRKRGTFEDLLRNQV